MAELKIISYPDHSLMREKYEKQKIICHFYPSPIAFKKTSVTINSDLTCLEDKNKKQEALESLYRSPETLNQLMNTVSKVIF